MSYTIANSDRSRFIIVSLVVCSVLLLFTGAWINRTIITPWQRQNAIDEQNAARELRVQYSFLQNREATLRVIDRQYQEALIEFDNLKIGESPNLQALAEMRAQRETAIDLYEHTCTKYRSLWAQTSDHKGLTRYCSSSKIVTPLPVSR